MQDKKRFGGNEFIRVDNLLRDAPQAEKFSPLVQHFIDEAGAVQGILGEITSNKQATKIKELNQKNVQLFTLIATAKYHGMLSQTDVSQLKNALDVLNQNIESKAQTFGMTPRKIDVQPLGTTKESGSALFHFLNGDDTALGALFSEHKSHHTKRNGELEAYVPEESQFGEFWRRARGALSVTPATLGDRPGMPAARNQESAEVMQPAVVSGSAIVGSHIIGAGEKSAIELMDEMSSSVAELKKKLDPLKPHYLEAMNKAREQGRDKDYDSLKKAVDAINSLTDFEEEKGHYSKGASMAKDDLDALSGEFDLLKQKKFIDDIAKEKQKAYSELVAQLSRGKDLVRFLYGGENNESVSKDKVNEELFQYGEKVASRTGNIIDKLAAKIGEKGGALTLDEQFKHTTLQIGKMDISGMREVGANIQKNLIKLWALDSAIAEQNKQKSVMAGRDFLSSLSENDLLAHGLPQS